MLVGLRVARSLFLRLNLNVRISFLSRIYTLYTNKRLLCFVRSSVATAIKADLSQRFLMFCCFFFVFFLPRLRPVMGHGSLTNDACLIPTNRGCLGSRITVIPCSRVVCEWEWQLAPLTIIHD